MAALLAVVVAPLAFGANALFPKPLHLVRRVDDPISKTSATIDEYCAGNRVVTVRGSKVAIADYDAQQLTEIDHAAQTWSVTPFADIARSGTDLDARIGNKVPAAEAKVTALGRMASGDGYVGIPAAAQTKFGGRMNDDAPPDNGMTVIGDLTGPGIDAPIRLVTKPGHLFQLTALNEKDDYVLFNIYLGEVSVASLPIPRSAIVSLPTTSVAVPGRTAEDCAGTTSKGTKP